jgi:hypothetical protein
VGKCESEQNSSHAAIRTTMPCHEKDVSKVLGDVARSNYCGLFSLPA